MVVGAAGRANSQGIEEFFAWAPAGARANSQGIEEFFEWASGPVRPPNDF